MADRIQLNQKSYAKLSRRGLILGGLQVVFIACLATRMRKLQVEEASEYRLLADENRINIRLIAPSRGEVYDRNGKTVARNEQSFRITIVKEDAGDIEQTLYSLSNLIKISQTDATRVIEEIGRSAPFLPVTVRDQLSFDEIARIAANTPNLPGVSVEQGLSRIYPSFESYAHVVGYVGPVSDNDLKRGNESNPLLKIPRFQVGKVGVEKYYEDILRGSAGVMKVEVNALGRVMRNLDRKEGKPGNNIQLTVDTELQSYIQARLGSESASAVVMNVFIFMSTYTPDAEVRIILFTVMLRYLGLVLILLEIIQIPYGNADGNLAHLGGAGLGVLYAQRLQQGSDIGLPF